MTTFQKVVKYFAIALAIVLTAKIIAGILSVFGVIGFLSDGKATSEEMTAYEVSTEITSLNLSVNAADLTIEKGEKLSVESNLNRLTVKEKNGTLVIEEDRRIGTNYSDAVLILYVPENTVFDKVTVTTGAGKLTADVISANSLDLTLGAGEVSISELNSERNAHISGGAGKITISDGTLKNIDFEMGVGEFDLRAALTGDCEFDLGIGSSNITLIGSRDDYRIDVSKGVGNVTVDGVAVNDLEDSGIGQNDIEINGGIGEIVLSFEEN